MNYPCEGWPTTQMASDALTSWYLHPRTILSSFVQTGPSDLSLRNRTWQK